MVVDGVLPQSDWLRASRIYLAVSAFGYLAWEVLHLPLYTIWTTGTTYERVFAVVHCTVGDVLIALVSLTVAVVLVRRRGFLHVAVLTIVFGVAYTGFSEWLNVSVRRSWAYSEWMPVVPLGSVRIGLSPLLQWIVVPWFAFGIVRRTRAY